jgi:hypothetical protein
MMQMERNLWYKRRIFDGSDLVKEFPLDGITIFVWASFTYCSMKKCASKQA